MFSKGKPEPISRCVQAHFIFSPPTSFPSLEVLRAGSNEIERLRGALEDLPQLKELEISGNRLYSFLVPLPLITCWLLRAIFDPTPLLTYQTLWQLTTHAQDVLELARLPKLELLYLKSVDHRAQPLVSYPDYVPYVVSALPRLQQLDGFKVAAVLSNARSVGQLQAVSMHHRAMDQHAQDNALEWVKSFEAAVRRGLQGLISAPIQQQALLRRLESHEADEVRLRADKGRLTWLSGPTVAQTCFPLLDIA